MAKGKAAAIKGSSKSKQPPAAGPSSSSLSSSAVAPAPLLAKWPPFKPPLPVTNLSLEAPAPALADKIVVARNFFPKSLCRDYVAYLRTRTFCPWCFPLAQHHCLAAASIRYPPSSNLACASRWLGTLLWLTSRML